MKTCGADEKSKAENPKLESLLTNAEAEIPPKIRVTWNLDVCVLQVDGNHPISRAERLKDQLCCLHMKMGQLYKTIEARKVDNWALTTCDLRRYKETTVKAGFRGCRFDGTLRQQVCD